MGEKIRSGWPKVFRLRHLILNLMIKEVTLGLTHNIFDVEENLSSSRNKECTGLRQK